MSQGKYPEGPKFTIRVSRDLMDYVDRERGTRTRSDYIRRLLIEDRNNKTAAPPAELKPIRVVRGPARQVAKVSKFDREEIPPHLHVWMAGRCTWCGRPK